MIKTIYGRALSVISRKPMKLWGLSLLSVVLIALAGVLFGIIPGVNIALVWLLTVSMTMVYLHGYLGEEVHTVNLFECFRDWPTIKRVLLGMGYKYLWIVLWALIPIVGIVFAIIRSYEYALTAYILVNEPEVPITEAIEVSKQRTDGFKAKMFWADILWVLLVWVAMLVLALLGSIPYVGVLFIIVMVVMLIAVAIFSELFKGLVHAAFYVEIQRQTGEGPQFDDSMNVLPERTKHASAPAEQVKFCPECGSRNAADSKFCVNCGHPFAAPVQDTVADAAEEAADKE